MGVGSAGVLLSSIVIKLSTKVCVKGVEYSSRSLLQCTICDSNCLSHTAQFNANWKVWNHACSLSSRARFDTDHNQSLHQTAGAFFFKPHTVSSRHRHPLAMPTVHVTVHPVSVQSQFVLIVCLNVFWTIWGSWDGFEVRLMCNLESFWLFLVLSHKVLTFVLISSRKAGLSTRSSGG